MVHQAIHTIEVKFLNHQKVHSD